MKKQEVGILQDGAGYFFLIQLTHITTQTYFLQLQLNIKKDNIQKTLKFSEIN